MIINILISGRGWSSLMISALRAFHYGINKRMLSVIIRYQKCFVCTTPTPHEHKSYRIKRKGRVVMMLNWWANINTRRDDSVMAERLSIPSFENWVGCKFRGREHYNYQGISSLKRVININGTNSNSRQQHIWSVTNYHRSLSGFKNFN